MRSAPWRFSFTPRASTRRSRETSRFSRSISSSAIRAIGGPPFLRFGPFSENPVKRIVAILLFRRTVAWCTVTCYVKSFLLPERFPHGPVHSTHGEKIQTETDAGGFRQGVPRGTSRPDSRSTRLNAEGSGQTHGPDSDSRLRLRTRQTAARCRHDRPLLRGFGDHYRRTAPAESPQDRPAAEDQPQGAQPAGADRKPAAL